MKNLQKIILTVLTTLFFTSLFSQSELFYPKRFFKEIVEQGDYIWVISSQNGLIRWNKSGTETTYFNKANSGLLSSKLSCVHKDAEENLWIGTEDAGLIKYDGDNWTVYNTSNSDIPADHILAVTTNQGNVWIGTYQYGVAKLSGANSWTVYNTSNSEIAENTIESVHVGSDGKVYFGWSKLSILNGSVWETFNFNDMGCGEYWDIEEDSQGDIWMTSYSYGLAKYDGENFTVYNKDNSTLPINYLKYIYIEDENTMWITSRGEGLLKFDGTTFEKHIPTFDNYEITMWEGLCPDGNGNIMAATGGYYFAKFDKTSFTEIDLTDDTPLNGPINYIKVDKNNKKLIATNKEFIVRDNNQWADVVKNRRSNYSATDKNDTIFVATDYGLYKNTGEEWVNYTTENSIIKDNNIYCVTVDTNDMVWFSPKDRGLQGYKDGQIINADYAGLCSLTITELFTDSKGYVWAGSYRQGISYYKDSSWHTYDIDPENTDKYLLSVF